MAQHETVEKKPKKRSRAGIVVLILLLLLAGTVGYLYYSAVKAPLKLDDPQKLAASAPMSAAERFQFSAADGTAQVKLDKTDLWNMILTHAGDDFLEKINQEVSSYGLTVSGCAIVLEQEQLRLDLELFYREIRLVAKVPCDLDISDGQILVRPTGLKIGVLPLPVGGLLSGVELEYDHRLPVLAEVTGVSVVPGSVLVSGLMEQDVRSLLPLGEELDQAVVFCKTMQPLVDALREETGFSNIMAYLEQHPGSVEALYRELFTLTQAEVAETYLEDRYGLTERFLPGIDFDAVAEEQKVQYKELNVLYITLKKFFTNAVNEYNEKRLSISDGQFIYEKEPFRAALFEYRKYGSVFEVLDPEPVFLIVVDARDGFIRKTSSFYRMVDENQQFTREVDLNKTYILGCVIRSVDGEPYLLYETELTVNDLYVRQITLQALTEDEVAALQEPGKIGVWTNK